MTVVDSHMHLWDLDRVDYPWLSTGVDPINRSFAFSDIASDLRQFDIDAVILVQAADSDADTDYMIEIARAERAVVGIVGCVPLDQPSVARSRIAAIQSRAPLVGIRALNYDMTQLDTDGRADLRGDTAARVYGIDVRSRQGKGDWS